MMLTLQRSDPTQDRINNFLPPLSNFRFGNDIFANLGNSQAFISGNNTFQMNQDIAAAGPIRFDFPPIFGGDSAANAALDAVSVEKNGGETLLAHYAKNGFLAALAIGVILIGLFVLIWNSETVQEVKEKAVSTAETAAAAAV